MNLSDYRRIWIVGASSGIGAALAKALDSSSRTLFLSARSEPALSELALSCRSRSVVLPMDVNQAEEVNNAIDQITADGGIDMVILNAGTCEYMDSHQLDMAMLDRVMQTNFFSMVRMYQPLLDLLRQAKGRGVRFPKFVVMSSSVTYQALPRSHAYGASKAALRYFTECLKADVQQEGIDVRLISPGFVDTPLTAKNDFDMPFLVSAEEAADIIVDGLSGSRFDIAFPKRFTNILKVMSALPDRLRFNLLGKLSRHSATSHAPQ